MTDPHPAPILQDGHWCPSRGRRTFQACDPRTGASIGRPFPVSPLEELLDLARAGARAARELAAIAAADPEPIAVFLDDYARRLDADAGRIAQCADDETALGVTTRFLDAELPRTTGQLRQAAEAVRERSWAQAMIDRTHNIRSLFEPLGGVVFVLGPNNFPLAYNGVAGGDFAAAIAAGNPVLAKAHPAHPRTTELLAQHAADAVAEAGLPRATVQMFYDCAPEDGLALVRRPEVAAVGFTGGRRAGLSIKHAADETGKPVYLEMSSINPVFILPGALRERAAEIARELAASMLAAGGQQCTCPGLLVLPAGTAADAMLAAIAAAFEEADPFPRLTPSLPGEVAAVCAGWVDRGGTLVRGGSVPIGAGNLVDNTLVRVPAGIVLRNPAAFFVEAFGTAALAVLTDDESQTLALAEALDGQLTGSIYSALDGADDALADSLAAVLRPRVGRMLNDAVPTGVRVVPSMVHGGPFPATGHPGFTAVGMPTAIARFAARRCYDRVRPERLPPLLRDATPCPRAWRLIDDAWKRGDA